MFVHKLNRACGGLGGDDEELDESDRHEEKNKHVSGASGLFQ